jgi:pantoate--beta-alanine ligase
MIVRSNDPAEAREHCRAVRARGVELGFVPTMGALHEGHLELVRRAKRECAFVCASVFVNPLQFNDARDFERYPRDFEGDARLLETAGCDEVFTGTLAQFFPESGGDRARIATLDPGPAALGLEGAFRPGHFAGVATIVARLFEVVAPTRAYFGAKDFQQTLVVKHLAHARGGPQIVVCPTVRAADGLALSSRNALLTADARERAPAIHRALQAARTAYARRGVRSSRLLSEVMLAELQSSGLEVEYAEVRDPSHWTSDAPDALGADAVALIAARAGGVRLIDNLPLAAGKAP